MDSRGVDVIFVVGAGGNIGGEVTRALVAGGHGVRGLVRPGSTAPVPAGAEEVRGDLTDRDSLRAAFDGVTAAFIMAGYPDLPGVLSDMRGAGVERAVLLSTGAVVGGDLDNVVVRFNVVSEAAVRDGDLDWTVLRPSGFMSNTLQWVPQLRDGDTVHEPFADVPIAVIDPTDIAAVAAIALTETGHAGHSYRLTGPQALLPSDRARILGAALGREIALVPTSDADARAEMSQSMPPDLVDSFFQFFRRGGYDDSAIDDTVPRLLARPARTFTEWADAHTHAFDAH